MMAVIIAVLVILVILVISLMIFIRINWKKNKILVNLDVRR